MPEQPKIIGFPEFHGSHFTLILPVAEEELKAFFLRSGQTARLHTEFSKRLSWLEKYLERAIEHHAWFECVRNFPEIYSMRFAKLNELGNLRLLYCIEDGIPCILIAFLEHNKKDYQRAGKTATQRMKGL